MCPYGDASRALGVPERYDNEAAEQEQADQS
jgi:hypothetical protein